MLPYRPGLAGRGRDRVVQHAGPGSERGRLRDSRLLRVLLLFLDAHAAVEPYFPSLLTLDVTAREPALFNGIRKNLARGWSPQVFQRVAGSGAA